MKKWPRILIALVATCTVAGPCMCATLNPSCACQAPISETVCCACDASKCECECCQPAVEERSATQTTATVEQPSEPQLLISAVSQVQPTTNFWIPNEAIRETFSPRGPPRCA
ncbi:MAG: hypothetical protein KF836_00830 [Fimbriimonadaceae bacterium]|nr:hypothetical protein [Fimbriimonadaceae bacterium]